MRDVDPVSKSAQARVNRTWNSHAHLFQRIATVLRYVSCLSDLDSDAIEKIARNFSVKRFTRGETVMMRGHNQLGFVAHGSVRVILWKRKDLHPGGSLLVPTEIARLGPSEIIGELSLLNIPSNEQQEEVISSAISDVIILSLESFRAIFPPNVMDRITHAASIKLSLRTERAREMRSSPSGSPRSLSRPEWANYSLTAVRLKVPELNLVTVEEITQQCGGDLAPTGNSYRSGLDEHGNPLRPVRIEDNGSDKFFEKKKLKNRHGKKGFAHRKFISTIKEKTTRQKESENDEIDLGMLHALKTEVYKLRLTGMVAQRGGLKFEGIERMKFHLDPEKDFRPKKKNDSATRCPQHSGITEISSSSSSENDDDDLRHLRFTERNSRQRLAKNVSEERSVASDRSFTRSEIMQRIGEQNAAEMARITDVNALNYRPSSASSRSSVSSDRKSVDFEAEEKSIRMSVFEMPPFQTVSNIASPPKSMSWSQYIQTIKKDPALMKIDVSDSIVPRKEKKVRKT